MDNEDRDDLEYELINSSVMGFLLAVGCFISFFFSNNMEFSKDYRMTLTKELYQQYQAETHSFSLYLLYTIVTFFLKKLWVHPSFYHLTQILLPVKIESDSKEGRDTIKSTTKTRKTLVPFYAFRRSFHVWRFPHSVRR